MKTAGLIFVGLCSALVIVGCTEDRAPPAQGNARIVFLRGVHDDHYSEKANVMLDNAASTLSLPPNAYAMIDVPAGDHIISYRSHVSGDQECSGTPSGQTMQTQPVSLGLQQIKYIRVEYGDATRITCPNGGVVTSIPLRASEITPDQAHDIMTTAAYTRWHAATDFGTVDR